MPSIVPRFGAQNLQISYTPNAAIVAGQVVERLAGTRLVTPAGAGSLRVVGVALTDAPAAAAHLGGAKVGDELGVTVARNCVVLVTYALAAVPGDKLIAAASGQVTPAGAAPDARTVIGECFDAAANGATALALIY